MLILVFHLPIAQSVVVRWRKLLIDTFVVLIVVMRMIGMLLE